MSKVKVSGGDRWTEQQASEVLAEIERRGIPVNRFAAEQGLGAERLYRWKRLLARRCRPKAPATRFAELRVRPLAQAAHIEIDLSHGITVRVSGESRVADALALVSGLKGQ